MFELLRNINQELIASKVLERFHAANDMIGGTPFIYVQRYVKNTLEFLENVQFRFRSSKFSNALKEIMFFDLTEEKFYIQWMERRNCYPDENDALRIVHNVWQFILNFGTADQKGSHEIVTCESVGWTSRRRSRSLKSRKKYALELVEYALKSIPASKRNQEKMEDIVTMISHDSLFEVQDVLRFYTILTTKFTVFQVSEMLQKQMKTLDSLFLSHSCRNNEGGVYQGMVKVVQLFCECRMNGLQVLNVTNQHENNCCRNKERLMIIGLMRLCEEKRSCVNGEITGVMQSVVPPTEEYILERKRKREE